MKKDRILWGMTFIALALFLLVSKLGYFGDINVVSLFFTVFLCAIIFNSLRPVSFPGILFPLACLGIIYDEPLGIESITPWTILIAAGLLSIGLSMLFKKQVTTKVHGANFGGHVDEEVIDVEDESYVQQKVTFGACTKYINTKNFKQGDFYCSFGALMLYFDKADMDGDEATIRIDASFCGVELYVPSNWRIDNRMSTTLGGVDEKRNHGANKDKTLILTGSISFAGVDIIYV